MVLSATAEFVFHQLLFAKLVGAVPTRNILVLRSLVGFAIRAGFALLARFALLVDFALLVCLLLLVRFALLVRFSLLVCLACLLAILPRTMRWSRLFAFSPYGQLAGVALGRLAGVTARTDMFCIIHITDTMPSSSLVYVCMDMLKQCAVLGPLLYILFVVNINPFLENKTIWRFPHLKIEKFPGA